MTRPLTMSSSFLLAWVVFATTPSAEATTYISACGTYSGTDYTLSQNISTTTTGTCITLQNGADLNLGGHEIRCTNESADCGTAIAATANNSVITGPGAITSYQNNYYWTLGVAEAKKLIDVTISVVKQAVYDSSGNLVELSDNGFGCIGTSAPCVDVQLNLSTDLISNNDWWSSNSTYLQLEGKSGSGRGPIVEDNTMHYLCSETAIRQIGSTSKFRAFRNVINEAQACSGNVPFDSDGAESAAFSLSDDLQWEDNVCSQTADYCLPITPDTCVCPDSSAPQCDSFGQALCL